MVRNYKRKTTRKAIGQDVLEKAKADLQIGLSIRSVANKFGMNESTLRKRLKKGSAALSCGRFHAVFPLNLEAELAEHCKELSRRFYGLSFKDLQAMAYEFAEANGIVHPFDKSSRLAGRDWAYGFMKRNSTLSLKTPEAMSLGRAIGFNEPQWNIYQKNLLDLYNKYHFQAARIFNMDESGLSTVPNKLRKVIGEKGRNVSKIVSAERGVTVTVICCMSAGGNYVPPALIFPRKRHHDALLHGAPNGSIQMCSDSGFINSDLFLDWLKHFQNAVKSSVDDPVLLVLDNHSSHISLTSVLFCRQHSIHVVSLPPHSSHKTQPLDVCFYGPLKSHYASAAECWMATHPGRAITPYQVAELFNVAYSRCASIGAASKAFEVSGIWPLNRNAFTSVDFVGALLTDRPDATVTTEASSSSSVTGNGNNLTITTTPRSAVPSYSATQDESPDIRPMTPVGCITDESTSTAPVDGGGSDGASTSAMKDTTSTTAAANVLTGEGLMIDDSSAVVESSPGYEHLPESTSYVSPSAIRPFPKIANPESRKRRASMRSEVFTASPFKARLEEKQTEIEGKRLKMEEKRNRKKSNIGLGLSHKKKEISKKHGTKTKKKTSRDSSRRRKVLKDDSKKERLCKNKGKKANKTNRDSSLRSADNIFCPSCEEVFVNPPTEEWIQCSRCEKWWHEDCTSYECGTFVCELC